MIRHRFICTLLAAALLAASAAGCRQLDEEGLHTEVTIRLVMPDSRPGARLEIRGGAPGL